MAIENVGLSPSIMDTAKDLQVLIFLKNLPNGVLLVTQSGENAFIDSKVNGGASSSTTIDGYRVLNISTATHGVDVTVKRSSQLFLEMLKVFNQQQQFPSLTDQNGSIWMYSSSISMVQHLSGVAFLNATNGWLLNADKKIKEVTLSYDGTNLQNASYGIFKTAIDIVQGLLSANNLELAKRQSDLAITARNKNIIVQQDKITRQYANANASIGQAVSHLAQGSYDIAQKQGLNPNNETDIAQLAIGQLANNKDEQNAILKTAKQQNGIK